MTVNPIFSPVLLNNFCDDPKKGLAGFVSGDRAYEEISRYSVKNRDLPIVKGPYFGGLRATWITVKSSFESIFSIFCQSIAFVLTGVGLQKQGRIFTVLSSQCMRDWEQLCDQWRFQSPLLVPSFNTHQTATWDLYGLGSIPLKEINDEKVLSMTYKRSEFRAGVEKAMRVFYHHLEKGRHGQGWLSWFRTSGETVSGKEKKQTTLTFTEKYRTDPESAIKFLQTKYLHDDLAKPIQNLYTELMRSDAYVKQIDTLELFAPNGNCRGASLWFIRLFFKTQTLFESPHKHLISIANQFKTGIPKEAALLHGFHESEDLLRLKKIDLRDKKITCFELDHDKKSAIEKITSLDPGVYRVGAYRHSLVYIKFNETQSYVWNPSFGLFEMEGKELLDMILRYHYKPGDPDSHIYFHSYLSADPLATTG